MSKEVREENERIEAVKAEISNDLSTIKEILLKKEKAEEKEGSLSPFLRNY